MKTWEMIKELTENPEKKFKNTKWNDFIVTTEESDRITYDKRLFVLCLSAEWEEVKEPVDFMTAIKSGKLIKLEHELVDKYSLLPDYMRGLLMFLATELSNAEMQDIILNGKWYIED